MSEPQFSLSDYLSTVQEVIQIAFNEPVWVKAEIRNLNIKGGHYYDNHQAVLIWTFQLLEREPALNELAEIKKYFLLIFPDSVYQLA